MAFDASSMHSLGLAMDDESAVQDVGADEVRRIADAEIRKRCGGLKLASRIIGMATASGALLDESAVLSSMSDVLRRLSALRQVGLGVVGVSRDSAEFPAVFNAVTSTMLDAMTEEWKWGRASGGRARPLSSDAIARLFAMATSAHPERYETYGDDAELDIVTCRRLCVLEAIPKLYAATALCDYFQTDTNAMIGRMLAAVVNAAESHAPAMYPQNALPVVERAILQRMYRVSSGLMSEVFKVCAGRDVLRLKSMPELDRSVMVARFESLGGMDYSHVIDAHTQSMRWAVDTYRLIMESQG